MATWNTFASRRPEMAARAGELLHSTGVGEGFLATVAGDALPRIHPVNVGIVDGRLLTFVQAGSAKAKDLARDGRYALHAHQDPTEPHELMIRGRATRLCEAGDRDRAAASWPFGVDEGYDLYELGIAHVLIGSRDSAEEWPPRYSSWRAFTGAIAAML